MKKKISTLVISSLGLMALASGCAMEPVDSEDLVGTEEQEAVVCSNDQATNAIIASLAVTVAREIGRWSPKDDMYMASSSSNLALTQTAINRCNDRKNRNLPGANYNCKDTVALLGLQSGAAGMQFGGAQMTSDAILRQRLWSYWGNQMNCSNDQNGDTGQLQQCPGEKHELTQYAATTSGSTCAGGKDYWYKATYAAGHPLVGQPLNNTDAIQVRNNLKWAGESGGGGNPYLQFDRDANVKGSVKIDPLDENEGGGNGSTGAVEAAPNPVWFTPGSGSPFWKCDNVQATKVIGAPCTCNTTQRSWKAAIKAGFFSCNP